MPPDFGDDATEAARKELVEQFGRWLGTRPDHRDAETTDADLLVHWKDAYADGDHNTWTRADVDEFLLHHAPRKISASPAEAASIPGSIAAFLEFLGGTGRLSDRSDPADVLATRALAQRRAFLDAMADPANYGMGKRLLASAGFDLDELPDQAALDDAMARFNSLSFEERGRILGLEGDDHAITDDSDEGLPTLPVRATPSADELESAASASRLLREVDALHAALGPDGIKLTKVGNASIADGKRLVTAVGTNDRVDGIRSSTELGELFAVARVAQRARVIGTVGSRLVPVSGWTDVPRTERWRVVVTAALTEGAATLRFGAQMTSPLLLAESADTCAFHFLAILWLFDEPMSLAELTEYLVELSVVEYPVGELARYDDGLRLDISRDRARDVFTTLESAGVVHVNGDVASITDAGAWAAAPVLRAFGFGVLAADDVVGLTVDELLDLIIEGDSDPDALAALWLADRDPTATADEILATLLEDPDPVRLMFGFHLLSDLGPAAHDAAAAARDTPIGPHAWLLLHQAGVVGDDEIPRDVVIQAGIDHFLAMAELGSPADVVEVTLRGPGPGLDEQFIDDLAVSDHPRAGELLELLGRHHPDKAIGKHARKAAHRWRSTHPANR